MFRLKAINDRVLTIMATSARQTRLNPIRMSNYAYKCTAPAAVMTQTPMRFLSTNKDKGDGKWFVNNVAHLPIVIQREVIYHLGVLEFTDVHKRQDIDLKAVRKQYLKLAQQYHPDVVADKLTTKMNDMKFIEVKSSSDRIRTLDKESNGDLFMSTKKMKK